MRRILFVIGLAVGYVVGARAGRPAYDAVVERVKGAAGSDQAHQVAEKAKQVLEEKAPKVADVAEKAAATATGTASAAKDAGAAADSETASQPDGSAS
jgi:hypothetical protein